MIAANQALQKGVEKTAIVEALEKDTLSQTHPALCEKLGDLYFSLNRPEDAKASYERTLLLNPTRNQRNRLLLALAALESQAWRTK
jgi:predicted RNA polymerase sigma factor